MPIKCGKISLECKIEGEHVSYFRALKQSVKMLLRVQTIIISVQETISKKKIKIKIKKQEKNNLCRPGKQEIQKTLRHESHTKSIFSNNQMPFFIIQQFCYLET